VIAPVLAVAFVKAVKAFGPVRSNSMAGVAVATRLNCTTWPAVPVKVQWSTRKRESSVPVAVTPRVKGEVREVASKTVRL
jgi:hypothetical protein